MLLILIFFSLILPTRAEKDRRSIVIFNHLTSDQSDPQNDATPAMSHPNSSHVIEKFGPRFPALFDELLGKIDFDLGLGHDGTNEDDLDLFDLSNTTSPSHVSLVPPLPPSIKLVAGCFYSLQQAKTTISRLLAGQPRNKHPNFSSSPLFLVFLADTQTFALLPAASISSTQSEPLVLGPFPIDTLMTSNSSDLNSLGQVGRIWANLIAQWIIHEKLLSQWIHAHQDLSQFKADEEGFAQLSSEIDHLDDRLSISESNRVRDLELILDLEHLSSNRALGFAITAYLLPRTNFLTLEEARHLISRVLESIHPEDIPLFMDQFLSSAFQMKVTNSWATEGWHSPSGELTQIFTPTMTAFIEGFCSYLNKDNASSLVNRYRPMLQRYFEMGIPWTLLTVEPIADNHDPGSISIFPGAPRTSLELPGVPDFFLGHRDHRSPRELAISKYARWASNLLMQLMGPRIQPAAQQTGPLAQLLLNSIPLLPSAECGNALEHQEKPSDDYTN